MDFFVSKDGTLIAYERRGGGPPLVLVHGTGFDHSYWDPLIARLDPFFTIYSIDRRGRGQSEDAHPYAVGREYEDVAAMIERIQEKAFLLGHSYGALCSLEASLLTPRIRKMILDEPPVFSMAELNVPADVPERFIAHLEAGEAEKALLVAFEVGVSSADELSAMRSLPCWQAMIQAVLTIPREALNIREYSFDPSRFRNMETETLLLLGGESVPIYKEAIEALRAALPDNRLVVLAGQRHYALVTAPDLYAREVTGFFLEKNLPV